MKLLLPTEKEIFRIPKKTQTPLFWMLLVLLFMGSFNTHGQCPLPSGASSAGNYEFCIDNSNSIVTARVVGGNYVLLNVIKGFEYTFSVGNVWTGNGSGNQENLTLFDAYNDSNFWPAGYNSGQNGTSITWTSTISGQIKVLLSKNCGTSTSGGTITITLNSLGNTQDSPTALGSDVWTGHVYNSVGASPAPFVAANYAGYYNVGSETINEDFGGRDVCFPVLSNGTPRASIYTAGFAVQYRMQSTRAAGYYFFDANADDGIRLTVDGVSVFDDWSDHGNRQYCKNLIYLNGSSTLILDYYENGGGNVVGASIASVTGNTLSSYADIVVCSGTSAGPLDGSAILTCTGATTTSYQWQYSTDNSNFTAISGATSEDYTPAIVTTATESVVYYRRVLKANGVAITTENPATPSVKVTTNPYPIATAPATGVACSGIEYQSGPITTSSGTTFNWVRNAVVGITPGYNASTVSELNSVGLVKTFTLDPVGSTIPVNTTYEITPISAEGCPGPVFNLVVTVNPSLSAASVTPNASQNICTTGTSLTVMETGGGVITRKWGKRSVSGGAITAISGETASTYTPTEAGLTTGTWYVVCTSTPTCGSPMVSNEVAITVTPTVGTPTAISVSSGTEPTCQLTNGTTTTTYATTATNNTGFNWSLSNASAGNINSSGVMTWANGFSGSVNIQVTANGCNGPSAQVVRTVTLAPTVGTPTAISVSSGTEPTCQLTNGTTTTTYATTATNSTGFNWSLSNASAGSINASSGVMTWANGFSGSVNIQVTANGCNGPSAQVVRIVTVAPTVGTPTAISVSSGTEPTCQLANGTTTTTYATTATNNTGFNWSLSNASAGSINASSGVMTWANGFSGSVDIQVTANGCFGPSAQVVRAVTVTPTVGTPTAISVSSGTEPTCQLTNGTTTTTYATTATNNTGFNWSLSNASAGNINSSGVMTWANGFSGSVNIQVTANGCNGPSAQVVRAVTVHPLPNNVSSSGFSGGSFCSGSQATLTFDALDATGPHPYILSYSDGTTTFNQTINSNSSTSFDVSATANTAYTLLSITANGCVNSSPNDNTANVAFRVNPTATISGTTTVCQAAASPNISFTNPQAPGVTITYTINGGTDQTVAVSANSTATVAVSTAASGSFVYALKSIIYTTSPSCLQTISGSATVTVNPLPAAAGAITGTNAVCQGQNTVLYTVPAIANASTYIWTLPTGATIASGSGTNAIYVNYSMVASSGNITVKGNNSCGDGLVSANYAVTVNSTPAISTNYTPTACSGATVTVSPTNGGGNVVPVGTTYAWGLPTVSGGITGATALSGQASFVQTLVNTTNSVQTASYTVTASTAGCAANTFSVSITVYPKPTVAASVASQSICSGTAISTINLSNPNALSGAIDYRWTRDNTTNTTGMSTTGTGSSITGTLSNSTNVPQTTVFTIYARSSDGCDSDPITVSVTVNPIPTVAATPATSQTICSETSITPITVSNPNGVAGVTYSWTRDNTTFITGTSSGSGTSITASLTNTSNVAQTTVLTIKATANTCDSATTSVSVLVNPKPTVAVTPTTQTICGNAAIATITSSNPNSVAGTTYSWTRNNTTNVTGMAASGSGSTISGNLVNGTNSNQNTVFTVTATAGTCASTTTTATVTVKPTPTVAVTNSAQTICNATAIAAMVLSNPNNVAGTTYAWTRNNTANLTGIAASGTGTISGTLTNTQTTTQTTTFTITATANGCSSTTTATVTVYAPLVAPVIVNSQDVCVGQAPSAFYMSTAVSGGSGSYNYQWQISTRTRTGFFNWSSWSSWGNIGGANSPTYQAGATWVGTQYRYQLIVTDSYCTSQSVTSNAITISTTGVGGILDSASVTGAPTSPVCSGEPITFDTSIDHTNNSTVVFYWTTDNAYVTPTSGGPVGTTITGSFPNGTNRRTSYTFNLVAANNTNSLKTTVVAISPEFNNFFGTCSASSTNVTVQIYPRPTATATVPNSVVCNANSAGIVVKGNITDASTSFTWSRSGNANVTSSQGSGTSAAIAAGGSFTIPDVLTNSAATAQLVTYTITPYSNGCAGTLLTVNVTVAPTVTAGTVASSQTLCSGSDPAAFTQTAAATGASLSYQWQISTDNSTYSNISGATNTTYDETALVTATTWYRRVVNSAVSYSPPSSTGVTYAATSASCTATTTALSVTINTIAAGSISGGQTICSGGNPVAFTSVAATGSGTITYQWQSNTTGCGSTFTDISGQTGATYDIPSGLATTTYYRRVATSTLSGVSCTANSNCLSVFVNAITAGTVSGNQTLCSPYNPVAFTQPVGTGSGTLSYQWQSNSSGCGGAYTDIPGAVSAAYDSPVIGATSYFRRNAISTLNGVSCTANSSCITVTINPVAAGAIAGNRTVCSAGDPNAFTEVSPATGTALTYQWETSTTSASGPWTNVSMATSATYDAPGPMTQDTYYRRTVNATVNSVSCTTSTAAVAVYVNNVAASVVAGDQTLCNDVNPVAFTVVTAATGTGTLSYQWQNSTTSNSGPWSSIPFAIASTYDPSFITGTSYYQVVATSSLNGVLCPSSASNVITVTSLSKTWTGATNTDWSIASNWSPSGVPNANNCVVIPTVTNAPIIKGSNYHALASNLSVLNGGEMTVNSSNAITVTDHVNVEVGGTLTFENASSLIQINNVANTGAIEYKRTSSAMKNFDFTYWSSPVAGQTASALSPNTFYDKYYSYSGGWVVYTGVMEAGSGYAIRTPKPGTYGNGEVVTMPYSQAVSFKGIPNNGDISFSGVTADSYYLLGNPYPSAMDADNFILANSGVLLGTIYFWTHSTAIQLATGIDPGKAGTGTYAYTSDDYLALNLTGGLMSANGISAGQGFFAGTKESITGNTVVFNNSMRLSSSGGVLDNSLFYKTRNPKSKTTVSLEKHRVWLNFSNEQGAFKQALVGYVTGAVNSYDSLYDGESFDGNTYVDFYSVNSNKKMAIQGRALPFDENDQVPLGYKTTISGTFSIAIAKTDGLLSNQAVYLQDKLTNQEYNLQTGKYTFTTAKGTFDNRFVLKYKSAEANLSNPDFASTANKIVVSVADKQIKVNAFAERIAKVSVYDTSGKLVYQKAKIGENEYVLSDFHAPQQVLIVKTTLDNGVIQTDKVVF